MPAKVRNEGSNTAAWQYEHVTSPPSTSASYESTWQLFADWCTVTEQSALPASPSTVQQFLIDCPASIATLRRRLAAIDHHQIAAGHQPIGADAGVRRLVGRPPETRSDGGELPIGVRDALRHLPSHGWTQGLFGRRDRCLMVLARMTGLTYRQLAVLTPADIGISDGSIAITAGQRTNSLRRVEDPVLCAPCATVRWLQTHRVIVKRIATAAVADHLSDAEPVTDSSDHVCAKTSVGPSQASVPLFVPIDQWGHTPFPLVRLSPHAASRRTRDLMAGEVAVHRMLPTRPGDDTDVPGESRVPELPARYNASQWWAGVERRRRATMTLAKATEPLSFVDQQADELERRITDLLTWATSS